MGHYDDVRQKLTGTGGPDEIDTLLASITRTVPPWTADTFLDAARSTMTERGKTYDKAGGSERSMKRAVEAFNAVTGMHLTEPEGWLFMLLLKQVRQWSNGAYHHDSALDSVAYAALLAESLRNEH